MNGNACQNCQNSPWVQRANRFISNSSNPSAQIETIRFLLQNGYCGINNRTVIEAILNHLENNGSNLTHEEFRNSILTELKRLGTVATLVYPGPQSGVFIPCSEDAIKEVAKQVLRGVNSEVTNWIGISKGTSFSKKLRALNQVISYLKEII